MFSKRKKVIFCPCWRINKWKHSNKRFCWNACELREANQTPSLVIWARALILAQLFWAQCVAQILDDGYFSSQLSLTWKREREGTKQKQRKERAISIYSFFNDALFTSLFTLFAFSATFSILFRLSLHLCTNLHGHEHVHRSITLRTLSPSQLE